MRRKKKSKCLEVVMGNQKNSALGCVDIMQFAIGEAAREAAPYRKTAFQLRQRGDRSTEKTHYVECLFKEEWRFQREGKVQGSQTNSKEKFFSEGSLPAPTVLFMQMMFITSFTQCLNFLAIYENKYISNYFSILGLLPVMFLLHLCDFPWLDLFSLWSLSSTEYQFKEVSFMRKVFHLLFALFFIN